MYSMVDYSMYTKDINLFCFNIIMDPFCSQPYSESWGVSSPTGERREIGTPSSFPTVYKVKYWKPNLQEGASAVQWG